MPRTGFTLLRIMVGLFLLAFIGCGDEPASGNLDEDPVADIDLDISQLLPYCPYWYRLTFYATGSTDDVTPSDDLEVRWDRENDGDWDTDWQPMWWPEYYYTPDMDELLGIDSTWAVRCEVRDEAHNVSECVEEFHMGPFPVAPDILPTRVQIKVGSDIDSDVDTLHVDESFEMSHTYLCWGVPVGQEHEIHYLIDGELIGECTRNCSDHLCVTTGCGYTSSFEEPGQHTATVILDPDNFIEESDETNNELTKTLTVIQ